MAQYARIDNGIVAELVTPPGSLTISDLFCSALASQFVAAPNNVSPSVGWTYSGGTFAAPAAVTPSLAQQAGLAITSGLTIALSGSMTLAATVFPTDLDTQSKLTSVVTTVAATGAFPGGATSYPLKDSAGTWHTFTVAQYKSVAGAIAAYVAALFLIIDGNPLNASSLPASSVTLTV